MTTFDKEIGLIQGVKNEDEKIIRKIRSEIFKIALKFFADEVKAEDASQDIFIAILEKIKNQEIKTISGIKRLALWRCKDQIRKEHAKKRAPSKPILSIKEGSKDSRAVFPGSREDHESEEDKIKRRYIHVSKKTREGIERSLEYIEEFYRYKEQVKVARNKNDKTDRILKDFFALKEKIENIAGHFIKDKAKRYSYLQSKGALSVFSNRNKLSKEDIEKLEEFENLDFDGILPIQAYIAINKLIEHAEMAIFFKFYPSKKFLSLTNSLILSRQDRLQNIPDMRIEPPRLMYAIWSRVEELRRGSKEVNHQKLKIIFSYHKLVTKNTRREFLFKSVRDDLINYETIRKIQYHKPKFKRLYNKLVGNIYKTSFLGF